ncbi:MAG TPA: hypothetical protein VLV31_03120 [Candidatus Acidoferrales bacterium]|nr:hypothetical protein [Candidatus Acidoferrales bacterium]
MPLELVLFASLALVVLLLLLVLFPVLEMVEFDARGIFAVGLAYNKLIVVSCATIKHEMVRTITE